MFKSAKASESFEEADSLVQDAEQCMHDLTRISFVLPEEQRSGYTDLLVRVKKIISTLTETCRISSMKLVMMEEIADKNRSVSEKTRIKNSKSAEDKAAERDAKMAAKKKAKESAAVNTNTAFGWWRDLYRDNFPGLTPETWKPHEKTWVKHLIENYGGPLTKTAFENLFSEWSVTVRTVFPFKERPSDYPIPDLNYLWKNSAKIMVKLQGDVPRLKITNRLLETPAKKPSGDDSNGGGDISW